MVSCSFSSLTAGGEEKRFDETAGEQGGVVPDEPVLLQKIARDESDFPFQNFVPIDDYGFGPFCTVPTGHIRRNSFAIGDDSIQDAAPGVVLDCPKMVTESIVRGFPRLGHEVGNVNARCFGTNDRVSNFRDEEIRNDASVKRPGTHENEVGRLNRFDGFGERVDATGVQLDFANRKPTAGDVSFALYPLAVSKGGNQVDIGHCRGKDPALNRKDLARNVDGFGKVTGHLSKCRKKKITEIVTAKT